MDLHTGVSVWQARTEPLCIFPALTESRRCEVAIIGGGVTGALLGHQFSRAGVHTVLLDKRQPSRGSTVASTGLLQYEIDTHLTTLIRQVGQERAVHAYRRGLRAVDELEEIAAELGSPCGFSRRNSLYIASRWWHTRALRREFACRAEHGLPVQYVSGRELRELSSISASGAILSSGTAQFDPYTFTQRLLQAGAEQGLEVYGDTRIEHLDERTGDVVLQTNAGRLTAQAVVVATGYESAQFLPSLPGNLQSTYVIASQPLSHFPGWPDGCLLWETARPYFYARQTEEGRILVGGGDSPFSDDHERDRLVERKSQQLLQRFRQWFPEIPFQQEFTWAGTFAQTKDGLAYIGLPAGRERTYFALGFGGNGFTFSVIAAKLIVDLFCRRPNPDAEVFSFQR